MTKYRILVTGSRYWPRSHAWYIYQQLDRLHELYCEHLLDKYDGIVVVHGRCREGGVDLYADEWARRMPFTEPEPHPADWKTFGRSAGFRRNAEMVALGADICIGFPGELTSRGTIDCMERARAAGIETYPYPWSEIPSEYRPGP
jgi:hypothetical protein